MPATVTRPGRAGVTSIPGRRSRLIRLASIALPAARLGTPPLRTTGSHQREQRPASWLELFFDLVFAGAIGQLAGALQDHPALGTLARFAMLFTPIWWLWVQFTFYADRHESDDAAHRAAFLSAMVLCVGLAASGPRALAGHATAFIVAVILLRGLQLLLYARARRHQGAVHQVPDLLRCSRDPVAGLAYRSRHGPVCLVGSGPAHRRGRRAGDAPAVPPS